MRRSSTLVSFLALAGCGPSLRTQTVTVHPPPVVNVAVTTTALQVAGDPTPTPPEQPIASDGGPSIVCPPAARALAGQPVQLTAQVSGDGVRVRWSVRAAPQDNRAYRFAQVYDANDTDSVVAVGAAVPFTSVIVGDYVLVAEARDTEGRTAQCETPVAMAGHGLRVELSWNTDGTDVDLHMTRGPRPAWTSQQDCHYAARRPDTGLEEPRQRWLDTDDVDGEGPENIRVDAPDMGEDHDIGVHYYSSHGRHGPTRAIVMVYCGEQLAGRYERDLIGDRDVDQNDFWHVARVRFGPQGCQLQPVNRVTTRAQARAGG